MKRCCLRRSPNTWNVTSPAYQASKEAAAACGYEGQPEIEFLLAKGVQQGSEVKQSDASLKTRFDLIVSPPTKDWADRRNALLDIVGLPTSSSGPQIGSFEKIPDEISFSTFVAENPKWGEHSSWVFFRDHPAVKDCDVLIQRVQTFGCCAIHAPVSLQHYLVALHTNGLTAKTVDMPLWLRKHASSKILEGIVFGNGVVSGTVLSQMLVPHRGFRYPRHLDIQDPNDFAPTLQQYGPGLVVSWRVAAGFDTPSSSGPHLGAAPEEHSAKPDYRHSMLVVGHRTEGRGSRLLLQNWWRRKQFVEVDEDYFLSCNDTSVRFVVTPQTRFPPTVEVTGDAFAVSAADGAGVSEIGEPTRNSSRE